MNKIIAIVFIYLLAGILNVKGQNITYSEVEKADNRSLTFEILGNFGGDFLIYKNQNKRQELAIYDNGMVIKKKVDLDFISDRVSNIDFVTYPNYFLMVWQFQKGNTSYCKAAKMSIDGQLIGNTMDLDTTREAFFSSNVSYNLAFSENKKKVLLYKIIARNNLFNIVTKIYDENLILLDSTRKSIDYNDRREAFGDLLIDNDGNYLFTKVIQNAREEYINTVEVNIKKINNDTIRIINVPLNEQLIQEPIVKIDNINGTYVVNAFSYKKNGGNVDGIFTATIARNPTTVTKAVFNIFNDSLRSKLSGKTDYRTAFDNFNMRNIILKKDGGFIVLAEEYFKQRRYGGGFNDRFFNNGFYNNRYYGSMSDYYLFNRGYYGYYRPFNDPSGRDVVYNYNDIASFSFDKNLVLQWNNVINKTTSDVETDNFLSFANMNAGAEIHFLFLQKDNNRQILSDHAIQPNGSLIRYATLKSREAGFYFMPRLARQTGARQMIIPCIVRNNIAFAKIDF